MSFHREATFFSVIAPEILAIHQSTHQANHIYTIKVHPNDTTTDLDIAIERQIVKTIHQYFPSDKILSEEEHTDTTRDNGRVWIIDPLCGTNNLSRHIYLYCTNIALAIDGHLVASCVINFMDSNYYWSVGAGVFEGNQPFVPTPALPGTTIDVDLGTTAKLPLAMKQKHIQIISYLQQHTDYMLLSLNSSLASLFVALGRLDGIINIQTNPWDVCASSFLAQQLGCAVCALDGSPWTIDSPGYIFARTDSIKHTLITACRAVAKHS